MRLIRTIIALAAGLAGIAAAPAGAAPPIRHVFVIVLENKAFGDAFGGASAAPYLAHTLAGRGKVLANYYGVMHESFGNYVAMVSGQAGNPQGQADCPAYADFAPGTPTADGQFLGQGCVYPAAVPTIADQLRARRLSWRGYMEDMGNDPSHPPTCRHPPLNTNDPTFSGVKNGDQYATRHNPFVYFHSIIDDPAVCNANDVPLDRLPGDLRSEATTANYSFITPNFCNSGHDKTCVDGRQGGLPAIDAFLRRWVPLIAGSPAFAQGGLLAIVFDEAPAPPGESTNLDATACPSPCLSPTGPNTPNPGGPLVGAGGGRVGALVISPWVRAGTVDTRPYNHYGLLRSVEDVFGLAHLGYAGLFGQTAFGDDVYDGDGPSSTAIARCSEAALPKPRRGRYRRGALIASARIVRRRGRARLELAVRHRATLDARERRRVRGRARSRRVGPHRVRACRTYRVTLSRGHGRVAITARAAGGREARNLRF